MLVNITMAYDKALTLFSPVQRQLAPYAAKAEETRGRLYEEPESLNRTPFQRDRDRIIHSSAFRRLTHKTQVFVYHEGDHYRSRLTHTLEVAQIARTLSRSLGLDEDLAETLALAHDLGHPPFGHAGEKTLSQCMSDFGGFDHNAQSLRVITHLERKYATFDGLNLTWETLEGLVKHNGPLIHSGHDIPDTTTQSFAPDTMSSIPETIIRYNNTHDLKLDKYASAEAQVAAVADDIAYNNHDIDDALRAGLITTDHLRDIPLTARIMDDLLHRYPNLEQRRLIYEINRRLITVMVDDIREEALRRLAALNPHNMQDIQIAPHPVVCFSDQMFEELEELRFFLLSWVYRNPRVEQIMQNAMQIVDGLFHHFMAYPQDLPKSWQNTAVSAKDTLRARLVCDFVAGMTDRYAIEEHRRLFDETPELL